MPGRVHPQEVRDTTAPGDEGYGEQFHPRPRRYGSISGRPLDAQMPFFSRPSRARCGHESEARDSGNSCDRCESDCHIPWLVWIGGTCLIGTGTLRPPALRLRFCRVTDRRCSPCPGNFDRSRGTVAHGLETFSVVPGCRLGGAERSSSLPPHSADGSVVPITKCGHVRPTRPVAQPGDEWRLR